MNEILKITEQYGNLKEQEKGLKTELSKASDTLKDYFSVSSETELESDSFIVKCVIQHRETINEAKLLAFLHLNNLAAGIIKTKEYVDMDALEAAIYRGEIDPAKIAICKETNDVQTLRYKRKKEA